MKIAFILPSLNDTAPIKLTNSIVNSLLDNNDIEIDIYYFDESVNSVKFNTNTYHIDFFDTFNYQKYDILHSVMFRPDLYIFFHRKKIGKIRCISSIHQYISQNLKHSYNKLYSLIFTPLWHMALNSFDDLIVLSNDMNQYYHKKLYPRKHIIYNGFNKVNSSQNDKICKKINKFKNSSKLIACVGGLTTTKGFDQVIRILSDIENTKLIIIGEGKEKNNLIKLSNYYKCNKDILFLGHIQNAGSYMNLMDMILIPSRSEGFPLVLLEAISQKVKILCSDIFIFKELFNINEIAFFALEDLEDLKNKINIVLEAPYTDNAFLKYKDIYTEQQMINKYLNVYYNGVRS